MTDELSASLLNALYVDFLLLIADAHRIEANYLFYSFFHRCVFERSCYCEIFQFIKDEVYLVIVLSFVNPDERI
jgi:hypothetical protein